MLHPSRTVTTYVPPFETPYVEATGAVTDFEYDGDLHILRLNANGGCGMPMMGGDREASYIVERDFTVSMRVGGTSHTITVPRGMLTDLASVPRLFRWLIGRVGPHLEAAIVHDFMYVAWQDIEPREARRDHWRFANDVMVAGMERAGVPRYRCVLVAWALRWFSWTTYLYLNPHPRYRELDGY